jgi:hypothetical protein
LIIGVFIVWARLSRSNNRVSEQAYSVFHDLIPGTLKMPVAIMRDEKPLLESSILPPSAGGGAGFEASERLNPEDG